MHASFLSPPPIPNPCIPFPASLSPLGFLSSPALLLLLLPSFLFPQSPSFFLTSIHLLLFSRLLVASLALSLPSMPPILLRYASRLWFFKLWRLPKIRSIDDEQQPADDVDGIVVNARSLLDLPDLVLDVVLSKLHPRCLCRMASTCRKLWRLSTSNHLWLPLFESKWKRVIGDEARKKLQAMSDSLKSRVPEEEEVTLAKERSRFSAFLCARGYTKPVAKEEVEEFQVPADSLLAWYRALETGALSFPAQVYNREHGHVGFLLSCYDAVLIYDCKTDTFQAEYSRHGSRNNASEEKVDWKRVRAPPVFLPREYEIYPSDSLDDLRPGDHVEVQWRRNKDFPYGWWYAVVGHSDACGTSSQKCCCHLDGTMWLEFNQYAPTSQWRRASLDRKTHREEGNATEGFYAGIRKLHLREEISVWQQFWPPEPLH